MKRWHQNLRKARSPSRPTMEHMLEDVPNVDLLLFKTWFLSMRQIQQNHQLSGLLNKLEIILDSNLTKDNIYLVVTSVGKNLLKSKQSVLNKQTGMEKNMLYGNHKN